MTCVSFRKWALITLTERFVAKPDRDLFLSYYGNRTSRRVIEQVSPYYQVLAYGAIYLITHFSSNYTPKAR